MAIEKVREYLRKRGMEERIQEFSVSSATVALASEALGCPGALIAKTLSFKIEGRAVLVVASGDARVDNRKFKAAFATKAKMLSAEEVDTLVGHSVGGVCPFAVNEGVTTYLDVSLRRFPYACPACGSGNSAIKLSLEELEELSLSSGWVDVCSVPEA